MLRLFRSWLEVYSCAWAGRQAGGDTEPKTPQPISNQLRAELLSPVVFPASCGIKGRLEPERSVPTDLFQPTAGKWRCPRHFSTQLRSIQSHQWVQAGSACFLTSVRVQNSKPAPSFRSWLETCPQLTGKKPAALWKSCRSRLEEVSRSQLVHQPQLAGNLPAVGWKRLM